jgi:hypothetical protein
MVFSQLLRERVIVGLFAPGYEGEFRKPVKTASSVGQGLPTSAQCWVFGWFFLNLFKI